MNNWGWVLGSGFGAALIWGAVALIKAIAWLIANRGITKANAEQIRAAAAEQISGTAADLVRQIRDDAHAEITRARVEVTEAKNEAVEARREASDARREAVEARREAMDISRDFRRLKTAILSPYATLDQLREMVGGDTGSNGVAAVVSPL